MPIYLYVCLWGSQFIHQMLMTHTYTHTEGEGEREMSVKTLE